MSTRLVEHWALRVRQNLDAPPRAFQQCATLWIEEVGEEPAFEYIATRAKIVDMQLLEIFGRVDANREWTLAHTLPVTLYDADEDYFNE